MVIVSVFLYSVLPWGSIGLRVVCKLLLLPLVMGDVYKRQGGQGALLIGVHRQIVIILGGGIAHNQLAAV